MWWSGLSSSGTLRFLPRFCSSQTEDFRDTVFLSISFIMAMMLVLPFAYPPPFPYLLVLFVLILIHCLYIFSFRCCIYTRKQRIYTPMWYQIFSTLSMMFTQIIAIKTYNINNTDIITPKRIKCEFTPMSSCSRTAL